MESYEKKDKDFFLYSGSRVAEGQGKMVLLTLGLSIKVGKYRLNFNGAKPEEKPSQ